MKRVALGLCLMALAASAGAEDRRALPGRNSYANPSAVIAAEIAFAQLAQDKGQWTAFAATAAPDAVMFIPEMVYAQAWLKGRANPPVAVKWQPHEVWSSCDGTVIVSRGAWQRPNSTGYFTTIWQRQKKGDYKWVLDHGDVLKEPLDKPEMLAAHIADCPDKPRRLLVAKPKQTKSKTLPRLDPANRSGKSEDGTLSWVVTVDPSGARNLSVDWSKDGSIEPMLIEEVAAEDAG